MQMSPGRALRRRRRWPRTLFERLEFGPENVIFSVQAWETEAGELGDPSLPRRKGQGCLLLILWDPQGFLYCLECARPDGQGALGRRMEAKQVTGSLTEEICPKLLLRLLWPCIDGF